MKLLTVCPSRIRPERIQDMLASYDATKSPWNDMVIYVADDDPRLEDYKEVLKDRNLIIGRRRTYAEVNNYKKESTRLSLLFEIVTTIIITKKSGIGFRRNNREKRRLGVCLWNKQGHPGMVTQRT